MPLALSSAKKNQPRENRDQYYETTCDYQCMLEVFHFGTDRLEAFRAAFQPHARWVAQVLQHRLCVGVTVQRPAFDCMKDYLLDMRIDVGFEGARRPRVGFGLCTHRAIDIETGEWHRPGDHLEQDCAQRIDVATRVSPLSANLLGRHVVGCSQSGRL